MPKRLTTEDFVAGARKVHGDKYDYSKTVYVGANSNLKIICPVHGEFSQLAKNHKSGQGCKRCAIEARGMLVSEGQSSRKKLTTSEFISQAREVHGDKYDYSKTIYVGAR